MQTNLKQELESANRELAELKHRGPGIGGSRYTHARRVADLEDAVKDLREALEAERTAGLVTLMQDTASKLVFA